MERGAATRGRVAKEIAGADDIEIKATVPHHQIKQALKRFGLTESNDEERYIYFFDTPKLDLLNAGIITRARRVVGDAHDSTVKFRPVNPSNVGKKWRRYPDFKIEADASETSMVKSASFSMPVAKGQIKRVAGGKKAIGTIFTLDQEKFLESIAGHKIDFTSLVVLGPLMAQRWKFLDPGCPWAITAELWTRADRQQMMELSIKAPSVQAAAAVGGFMAFLAEVGAERDKSQQTKTRWALDYYIAKLARPAGGTAAGKVTAKKLRQPARKSAPAKSRRRRTRKRA
jgi:adenylate cyclase class IV